MYEKISSNAELSRGEDTKGNIFLFNLLLLPEPKTALCPNVNCGTGDALAAKNVEHAQKPT